MTNTDPDALARRCPACEVGVPILVEQRGHLEVFRCSCGAEFAGTVYPSLDLQWVREVEVFAVWTEAVPSAAELRTLRSLFPEFANESLSLLVERLGRPEQHIGRFSETDAAGMQERASCNGLTLVSRPVATPGAA